MKINGRVEAHTTFTQTEDINAICQPLFGAFDLNYFAYCRLEKEAGLTMLTNDAPWFKFVLEYQAKFQNGRKLKPGFYLWETTQSPDLVKVARNDFQHYNGFYLVREVNGHLETGIFSAPPTAHNPLERAVNNIDALHKFMVYFRHQGKDLIDSASKQTIIVDEVANKPIEQGPGWNKDHFLKEIQLNAYTIKVGGQEVNITAQEWHCLSLLCRGNSAKVIAKFLNLSPRSVETYLAHLRLKLNCHSREALIALALQNDIV